MNNLGLFLFHLTAFVPVQCSLLALEILPVLSKLVCPLSGRNWPDVRCGKSVCQSACLLVCLHLDPQRHPLQRYMGYLCTRKAQYAPSGRNMHHGAQGRLCIWGTCAPSGCNMHHQGAMCTMGHKGDYIFWKITLCTTTMVYGGLVHHQAAICTTKPQCAPCCTRETLNGSHCYNYF